MYNILSPKCSKFMQQRMPTLLNERDGQIKVWCNAVDLESETANSDLNNLCIDSYFDYTSQMKWEGGLNGQFIKTYKKMVLIFVYMSLE